MCVRIVIVALLCGLSVARGMSPVAAEYAEIDGTGSTWVQNMVQQWVDDVQSNGMQVVYTGDGSSAGRTQYANGSVDFADSDIPYQGTYTIKGVTQTDDSNRPYAFLPVVGGGTSFTYQIKVGGHLVTNLRLSGETIAKIFTNQITNWDDPEITKDNGGHALPSLPITPVVDSGGSGETAQFTLWMNNEYPSLWKPYNGGVGGLTSVWPIEGRQKGQSGDSSVMSFIESSAGNGSIGYVQYSFPEHSNYPVVYMENAAGYFVQPTQYNVAVALTQAQIQGCKTTLNSNGTVKSIGTCSPNGVSKTAYLTQNLSKVYTYKDPRSYPMSAYSYMIIPTSSSDQKMTVAKRTTLAAFLNYSLCSGQTEAGPLGYSPMPLNLVQAAFGQLQYLGQKAVPTAVAGVNVANPVTSAAKNSCNNPTFVAGQLGENKLAEVAPMPLACQKATATPCGDGTVPPGTSTAKSPNGTTGTTGNTGTPAGAAPPGSTGTGIGGPGASGVPGGVDPVTGQTAATGVTGTGTATTAAATAQPMELTAERQGDNKVFGGVAVLELAAIVLIPGLYVAWLRRRKGSA